MNQFLLMEGENILANDYIYEQLITCPSAGIGIINCAGAHPNYQPFLSEIFGSCMSLFLPQIVAKEFRKFLKCSYRLFELPVPVYSDVGLHLCGVKCMKCFMHENTTKPHIMYGSIH